MDSPIISELMAAREKAWERLKTLAGLYVYYMNNRRDPVVPGRNISYSADSQTESEMLAIRKLLAPKEDPVFVVPSGRTGDFVSVLITVQENRVTVEMSKIIPVDRIVTPDDVAQPEADRPDDSDPTDLLKALEG